MVFQQVSDIFKNKDQWLSIESETSVTNFKRIRRVTYENIQYWGNAVLCSGKSVGRRGDLLHCKVIFHKSTLSQKKINKLSAVYEIRKADETSNFQSIL